MRLLVVEDYAFLRQSLVQGLREAGFAVDEAADGTTGLWHAQGRCYDVIVLDIMLPGIDGLALLKRLRDAHIDSSVLLLTARDTTDDRVTGLNLGADDYLVKPFAFSELLARVRALIRRRYNAKSPVIEIDDLRINTVAKSASRGGKPIDLSAKEFALLEVLALRRGEVVTRTEILQGVYDFASDPDSNVVDVFISHLRRKLEPAGTAKLIHTRRGQGYLLAANGPCDL